jgi:hypothetical protein
MRSRKEGCPEQSTAKSYRANANRPALVQFNQNRKASLQRVLIADRFKEEAMHKGAPVFVFLSANHLELFARIAVRR